MDRLPIRKFPKHTHYCVCTTISFFVIFRISQVSHNASFSTIRQKKGLRERTGWRQAGSCCMACGTGTRSCCARRPCCSHGGTGTRLGTPTVHRAHVDLHMSQAPDSGTFVKTKHFTEFSKSEHLWARLPLLCKRRRYNLYPRQNLVD